MKRLNRSFYTKPVTEVARALLGKVIRYQLPSGDVLSGMIVETEAYLGAEDKASHAYNLRRTERNEAMYEKGGHAYVYFTYGLHHCFNIVTGEKDDPQACLIRALEPLAGLSVMREFRSGKIKRDKLKDRDLCSGPAKLCQAFGFDLTHNRIDLYRHPELEVLCASNELKDEDVVTTTRVGVQYAEAWARKPLRFYISNNPHVSVK